MINETITYSQGHQLNLFARSFGLSGYFCFLYLLLAGKICAFGIRTNAILDCFGVYK
ncbi:hypothetical protein SBF1_6550005 [Candidatus Desulfosporosinus infrequens]|uniref:Uncharacterized protein n=1 Tax=Candidatus Desulfosporosinus infrequens TaxID=2043169 RepID=A0A2U3LN22_9FIRM|nr:hypothetical protein SBF1_6550005 [Candidatus Desulfosporosinus infrequens]